jgi:chaperonin GroES
MADLDMTEEPEAEEATFATVSPAEFVAFVTQSDNFVGEIADTELGLIAQQVIRDYDMDKDSMSDWYSRMERGFKLAQLVKDEKTYPFPGASNIKYPLITSAALQFNARAYPAIVPGDRPVKAKVWGQDPKGQKAAKAERVSEFMSYQLAAKMPEWDKGTDKLLVQLPIVGEMFRKWWFDPIEGRPKCRLIEAGKFVVNDKVTDLSLAPRCSEEFSLYPYEIETRINSGTFTEFEFTTEEEEQEPQDFIEQHTRLDLDEDGYPEPYIVTVHKDSQKVVRIVADFTERDVKFETETQMVPTQVPMMDALGQPVVGFGGQPLMAQSMAAQEVPVRILAINRGTYFVDFQFLPGLDGGFHGTGLGLLLGDISDAINTIMNMLLDAGHMASLGGGFIGSEFRMKGGSQRFRPGEWKKTQATGSDIRQSIVPMTFPGPDGTLYQMLGMLIEAGREIASVKDVMTGDQPRQQQTATTTIALIEQGMMVFTAAYKRIFRSCAAEYKLLAAMNQGTVSPEEYSAFFDGMGPDGQPVAFDPSSDFDLMDMDIQPVADPGSVTKMQQAQKAQFTMQLAEAGMVDRGEALGRIAEAMDIPEVEALLPKPNPMDEQMQQMQMQMVGAELELTMAKVSQARADAVAKLQGAQTDEQRAENEAIRDKWDAYLGVLDNDRRRVEAVLRELGRVAGQPGDGDGSGPNLQAIAGPTGIPQGGMVPGGTGFGF